MRSLSLQNKAVEVGFKGCKNHLLSCVNSVDEDIILKILLSSSIYTKIKLR